VRRALVAQVLPVLVLAVVEQRLAQLCRRQR
jgi:hypothetical protein